MSQELRHLDMVRSVVQHLCSDAHAGFLPSDVNAELRARGTPMGAWQVRGLLTELEAGGEIRLDPTTARWHAASADVAVSRRA